MSINIFREIKKSFEFKLEEFHNFYSFIEINIEESEYAYGKWFGKLPKDMSEDQKEAYLEEFISFDSYKNLLHSYYLITLYSLFEVTLNVIRNHAERKFSLNKSLTNLKGQGINRAKNYLTKIVKVPRSIFGGSNWDHIKKLQVIRNFLLHNDRGIPRGKDGDIIQRYIEKNSKLLDVNPGVNRTIIVKKTYCQFSWKNIAGFMNDLLMNIPQEDA